MWPDITTPRLRLRELQISDAPALFEIRSDVKVNSQLPSGAWNNVFEAEQVIREGSDKPHFVISVLDHNSSETPRVIGAVGINRHEAIYYVFEPAAWGKGYCTEAVRAFTPVFWKWKPEAEHLDGWVLEGNTASQNVLTKCGFVYEPEYTNTIRRELVKQEEDELKKAIADMNSPGAPAEERGLDERARNVYKHRPPICFRLFKDRMVISQS